MLSRNRSQDTGSNVAVCPNQPAAMWAYPRTFSALGATTVKSSPAAASRRSIARSKPWATSSACTWCIDSTPLPGIGSGFPAESVDQTAGSRLPNGPIGCQPGPTMCPGCREVVTSPPEAVSSFSIRAIRSFWTPYSPTGGVPVLSEIGSLWLGPCRHTVPQCSRCPTSPRSRSTSAVADSRVKQTRSTTTSGVSLATRSPKVPAPSSCCRSATTWRTCSHSGAPT
ncbi:hypothetical protein SGRIM119S_07891 [Streptomyces griseorubiginosus]